MGRESKSGQSPRSVGSWMAVTACAGSLAQGGMGTVAEVEGLADGRFYALKWCHVQGAGLKRFAREVRLMAQVRHPNVVPVVGLEPGSEPALLRDAAGGGLSGRRAAAAGRQREPRHWRSSARPASGFRRSTGRASFIGTSSRPTSCGSTAGGSRCPTSGWPSSTRATRPSLTQTRAVVGTLGVPRPRAVPARRQPPGRRPDRRLPARQGALSACDGQFARADRTGRGAEGPVSRPRAGDEREPRRPLPRPRRVPRRPPLLRALERPRAELARGAREPGAPGRGPAPHGGVSRGRTSARSWRCSPRSTGSTRRGDRAVRPASRTAPAGHGGRVLRRVRAGPSGVRRRASRRAWRRSGSTTPTASPGGCGRSFRRHDTPG